MVDTYALDVRHRDPEWKLQFDRTGISLILARRHDGGGGGRGGGGAGERRKENSERD